MELFAVFKLGVYRHECGGIFSTRDLAAEAARKLLAGERDSYHSYEVVPFELDTETEQIACKTLNRSAASFWSGGDLVEAAAVLRICRNGLDIVVESV